jgi:hypothetical protein
VSASRSPWNDLQTSFTLNRAKVRNESEQVGLDFKTDATEEAIQIGNEG